MACRKLSLPKEISSRATGSKLGSRVVMLIAPAVLFLPNKVPCGPRSTSIRSIYGEVERRRRRPRMIDLIDIEADARLQPVIGLADGDDAASEAGGW